MAFRGVHGTTIITGDGTKASSAQGSASSRVTVVLTAAVAALGGLLFGYDTSVISGAMLFLRTDFHLSDVQLEFAVGIALAGALVGAALAGYCTDRWGRRWMLLMTALGFGLFSVLSGLAVGLVSFSVARFFVGMCIGIASLTVPLYIAEMSPARIRGALVSSISSPSAPALAWLTSWITRWRPRRAGAGCSRAPCFPPSSC